MFALITSEELEELDQMVVKQLKNRYNDPTVFKRFVVGVDRSRMKFYDVEQDAQEELIDSDDNTDTPIFDKGQHSKFSDFKGIIMVKESAQYDNYLDKEGRIKDEYKATLDKFTEDGEEFASVLP